MSQDNVYAQIVSRTAVERAMVATLGLWVDDALGEIERVDGWPLNSIERPKGIVTASEFIHWEEDQIPVIVVINSGLASQPIQHAGGRYDATWLMGVAAIVSDVEKDTTRDLAGSYAAAVRMAVLQHSMLKSPLYPKGLASATDWIGEDDSDIPILASRSLGCTRVIFQVEVEGAVTKRAGPRSPSDTPWVDPGAWPEITSVKVNVEPVAIGGQQ